MEDFSKDNKYVAENQIPPGSNLKKEKFSNVSLKSYQRQYFVEGNYSPKYYKKYMKYKSKYINKKKLIQSGGSHPLSKWIHQENKRIGNVKVKDGPIVIYDKLVKLYGKPDILSNKPKGICIWYLEDRKNDFHHSIEMRDQYVEHCVPANHHDFLYSYIKIYIPPERLEEVMKVSGSIGYDGLQKLLYARCASLEANAATLAAVIKVINNTNVDYSDHILNRYDKYSKNVKYIKKELKKDRKNNGDKYNQPFSDMAFPDGCNEE